MDLDMLGLKLEWAGNGDVGGGIKCAINVKAQLSVQEDNVFKINDDNLKLIQS
jgi:hypothetical protein